MKQTLDRRQFLRAAAVGSGTAAAAWPQTRQKPNILFLLADDQRWDSLGCTGNSVIKTPHIDQLAANGVLFRNNFCATAICMTSRASILTGQFERVHGISDFAGSLAGDALARTYPLVLRQAGYRTGFIGKYGVGNTLPKESFDFFEGFTGQGKYVQQRGGETVHLTDLQGDQALTFLKGNDGKQPFCLSISFKAPHVQDEEKDTMRFHYAPRFSSLYEDKSVTLPVTAAAKYRDAMPGFIQNSEGHKRWEMEMSTPSDYQKSVKGYYRLITGIDEVVARIADELRAQGQWENTVVVYTSDNGFFLGERELSGKWLMHEESIRTPLIIRDPRLPKARQVNAMTLNVDLARTLLSLAGVPAPVTMQGRDLAPLLRGEAPAWRHDFYYSHLFQHPAIPKSEGVRNERWKYTRYLETPSPYEEMYDLQNDPHETANLARAGSRTKELETLRQRTDVWKTALVKWDKTTPWQEPAA